ncbi:helix-turn-helix domain-containing protein [Streptomyces sp. 35G-GA-8]|uniref:helix-turn-helix domain-containing protein n=1 Tax=Streptomyces sp. 35G-GA-8 TaxID=2939434 RepID=UPI0035B2D440
MRAARTGAGLTYEQLATHTGYSGDALARAASGRSVPQNLSVVLAYAQACGRNVKEAAATGWAAGASQRMMVRCPGKTPRRPSVRPLDDGDGAGFRPVAPIGTCGRRSRRTAWSMRMQAALGPELRGRSVHRSSQSGWDLPLRTAARTTVRRRVLPEGFRVGCRRLRSAAG